MGGTVGEATDVETFTRITLAGATGRGRAGVACEELCPGSTYYQQKQHELPGAPSPDDIPAEMSLLIFSCSVCVCGGGVRLGRGWESIQHVLLVLEED